MRLSNNALRGFAAAALLAALAGCSEYLERNNNVALVGGNAVHGNLVTQMVDPWPAVSANREIAFEGNRMETAVDRYRTGRVIVPHGIGTSAAYDQAPQQPANNSPVGPTVTQPAAPVK